MSSFVSLLTRAVNIMLVMLTGQEWWLVGALVDISLMASVAGLFLCLSTKTSFPFVGHDFKILRFL